MLSARFHICVARPRSKKGGGRSWIYSLWIVGTIRRVYLQNTGKRLRSALHSILEQEDEMQRSKNLVLTFLSPHPTRSLSAVQFLQQLFQLAPVGNSMLTTSTQSNNSNDLLDERHFGSSSSMSWHSTACACNSSGTILHFLSLANSNADASQISKHVQNSSLSLLSINECSITDDDALTKCRDQLSNSMENNYIFGRHTYLSSLEARFRGVTFSMMQKMGKGLQSSWLLPKTPAINLHRPSSRQSTSSDMTSSSTDDDTNITGLRELVLPFFQEYSTVQSDLSKSKLSRPLPGLYQYDGSGLIMRPLPAADEDLRLPPPSLIFQCSSLDDAQEVVEKDLGGKTSKIGWRGDKHRGSLIVSHPSITGLDVRISEDWILSSSFDEAEQAVLAGSLDDLQSSHVMSEGKHTDEEDITIDPKTNNADCWVEARSNVKRPSGFLKRFSKDPRIAKPPQLPYE